MSLYTQAARSSLQIGKCEKLLECPCSGQTPRQLPKDSQALACDKEDLIEGCRDSIEGRSS
jgi:hypothetical protein